MFLRFVLVLLLSLGLCVTGFALFREAVARFRKGSVPSRRPAQWIAMGFGATVTTIVILTFIDPDRIDPLVAPAGALVGSSILLWVARRYW